MKFYHFYLLVLIFLFSCKKKEPLGDPSIQISIVNAGVLVDLSGEISNLPGDKVKETGFVWSTTTGPTVQSTNAFSYSSTTSGAQFTYQITAGLQKDLTYYVRAYYVDLANEYHYSNTLSFVSTGTSAPALTLDKTYTWGDRAMLTLSQAPPTKIADIDIFIAPDIKIKPVEITGKNIYFIVPPEVKDQANSLYVTIYGQKSNNGWLLLKNPSITATANIELSDENFTITGEFFNPTAAKNIVKIGTANLDVVSATSTSLVVKANLQFSQSGRLSIQTGGNLSTESAIDYRAYKYFKTRADFPGVERTEAVSFYLDGYLYAGLGRGKISSIGLKDWWRYDLATNVWTRMADCPVNAWIVHSFSASNKGYVGMGFLNEVTSTSFYCYSPGTNTWTEVAPCPRGFTRNGSTFSTVDAGYLVGGERSGRASDMWKYVPTTNTWKRMPDYPGVATSFANTFVIGNKGYYLGGVSANFDYMSKEAWSFDFGTETWKKIANIPEDVGSYGGFSFGIKGKGYLGAGVIRGNFAGETSVNVYEYSPDADNWIKKDRVLEQGIRFLSGYTTTGEIGFIIGGHPYEDSFNMGSKKVLQFKP